MCKQSTCAGEGRSSVQTAVGHGASKATPDTLQKLGPSSKGLVWPPSGWPAPSSQTHQTDELTQITSGPHVPTLLPSVPWLWAPRPSDISSRSSWLFRPHGGFPPAPPAKGWPRKWPSDLRTISKISEELHQELSASWSGVPETLASFLPLNKTFPLLVPSFKGWWSQELALESP